MSLLFIAFIAGILTVLAPCILPLLPVIVGGSLDRKPGEKEGGVNLRRAFVVTGSLAVSLILFTLLLKVSTLFIDIQPEVWGYISGSIIIGFGLVSLFPSLWEKLPFTASLSAKSNMLLGVGYQKKSLMGDVIIGASLGPVFSTCSPTYFVILATVLPVSFARGMVYLGAYTVGLSLALLIIAFIGQNIMAKLGVAADPHGKFKRILGLLFLIVGIAIFTGYDKKVEKGILTSGFFDVTSIEQKLLQQNAPTSALKVTPITNSDANPVTKTAQDQATAASSSDVSTPLATTSGTRKPVTTSASGNTKAATATPKPPKSDMHFLTVSEKSVLYPKSAEITGVEGYINTGGAPVTIGEFKGKKVVLVDIWTYSCINCQRTLPYVTSWYEKYKDQGLMVIGVHTPEFAFEHLQANVEAATRRFSINYPVVLDNNYATWNAFGNQFWPRKYLVDIDGYIVYDHAGEGSYDEAEKAIQKALTERNARLATATTVSSDITKPANVVTNIQANSPETYFGASRNSYLANGDSGKTGEQNFNIPTSVEKNMLYLGGQWNIANEYAETSASVSLASPDKIAYRYNAMGVYLVTGAKTGSITVEVMRDGKPLDAAFMGSDVFVKDGKTYVTVIGNKLYHIIDDKAAGGHLLEFIISNPGLQVYTFTFG